MAEKEIYHLDLVIGIKGDSETKSKLSAMDRYFEQTHKKANILNKMSVSPTARIIDKATSRIEKINSSLNKINKMVASPTIKIKDKISGGLNIIRGSISKTIAAATSLQGVLLGVGGTWAGIVKPMQIAGDFEQTQMAFTTMLKSAQKANSFLSQAQNMANATPFEFPQLADASKKMLAFGWNVKSILPDLTTIGDAASGLGLGAEGINEITLALGQMKAKGVVQGDEILQLTEAGIPASKILQEQLGLTAEQVGNIGKQGLSADKAVRALLTGMDKRFGGMMQDQAKTALGLMSTLKDTFENKLMNPWGQGLWSGIKPGLTKVTDWLDKNDKKVNELGNLFKKAGQTVSTSIGGALEKSQQRLDKLMDSSQWKSADLGGKITLAWDKVIAEPFSSWWNGSGRPKINKVAGEIGSAIGGTIGGGITSFLDALGGKDSNKTGGAGTTAGTAFTNGFLQAFDTGKIIDKLLNTFKNANLNFLKNPTGDNFAKAGIMDYILFSSLGGAALLKGGFKLGKGAFKFGKWAFGKEGTKTAEGAAEKMAGAAGSTSAKASSASSKASKTANDLSEAAKNFRNAANEAKTAEKLKKSTQNELNKAIKDYKNIMDKIEGIKSSGGSVPKSVSKKAGEAQTRVNNARERAKSAGQDAKAKGTKSEAYTTARNTFKEARQVSTESRASRFFKFAGKGIKGIPIVGGALTLAGAGLDILTSSDKKKGAFGAAGNIAGGLAGAKAGATIGSAFGPAGIGIGGIAGGIAGSIGGEKALDWIYDKTGPATKYLQDKFGNAKKSIESKWSDTKSWFGTKVGTPFKNGAINTMNFAVGAFSLGKDAAKRAWAPYGQWLGANVFQPIKNKASDVGSWIGQKFGSAKSWAQTHWSSFSGWWGANVSTPVKGFASDAGSWIGEKFSSAKSTAHTAWVGFSGWWSKNIGEPTKSVATDVGSWIGDKLSGARTTVESAWADFSTWFKEHIGGPAYALLEKIMGKGQEETGLTPSNGRKGNVRANGGIVTGPEFSLIGEAGTEAVIPLSSARRNRGLSLWQQAGKMLGVRMFANGGIVRNGSAGGAKVAKATANISTSIALGDDALSQFKQYGNKVNTNLSSGILENKKVSTDSVNKVTNESGSVLNLFSKTGHVYGIGMNNDIAAGIQSTIPNVTSMVKTLTDKVITEFKNGFGIHSPSRVFYKLAQFIPQGFVNGLTSKDMGGFIKHWIGDISSMAGGAMSGNVSGWLSAALAVTGTPASWLPGLLRLVQAESGGNPIAVNPQAVGGEHATGLLQTLGSTFRQYAVKGLDNILNPIANAAAAINYIKARYGSVFNTPLFKGGSYVGYASGTDNAKPGLARINERGWEFVDFTGGEKVLNHNKSINLMERAANSLSRVRSVVSNLGIGNMESRDIPESSNNPVYYTSQPQMATAGGYQGDINVDVENNFNGSTDIDDIVMQATKKFATELKKTLQNIKR
ncbi:tape measure protein [Clostridium luticellarii]|uniref:Transglycosylase SLT domain protein n=1 Tax=Clostridium luticellarii TaxID=1691940 RepID=A0A2T0BPZ7_9CLOT|nr:tape measure protein [Clostridium luticellarii]PRR85956.1 Transglycosylase SLT domain protein [Clostridium luticellarii]